MKEDKSSLIEKKQEDLFSQLEQESMGDEVSSAAKILRSFVSQLDDGDNHHEDFFSVNGNKSDKKPKAAKPVDAGMTKEEENRYQHYINSAAKVSTKMEQEENTIIPRVLTPSQDGLLLVAIDEAPAHASNHIRLRHKGKATKKQLRRLREKIEKGVL